MKRFYPVCWAPPRALEPMPKAEALAEAKSWLRGLTAKQVDEAWKPRSRGDVVTTSEVPVAAYPFEHPYYWAAFVLVGDPN